MGHLCAGGARQALRQSEQLHEDARCHPSQLLHQPLQQKRDGVQVS